MWEDPIVAEVRRVRAAHAAKFNNDLLAIYQDLKIEDRESGPHVHNLSGPARRSGEENSCQDCSVHACLKGTDAGPYQWERVWYDLERAHCR